MKKIIIFSLFVTLFCSSCLTLEYKGKKPIFLVDAPGDLTVKSKGKEIEIRSYEAFSETTGPKGMQTKTRYKYPGILLKVKRKNSLELISGSKTVPVYVKGNPALGIVCMFFEIPFTLGIGTILDLATTSYFFPKSKYVDVKAYLEGTKPRSRSELRKQVQSARYVNVY